MKIAIGRYQNGVVLNPMEYVLESEFGKVKLFPSIQSAKDFLRENGVQESELDNFEYVNWS